MKLSNAFIYDYFAISRGYPKLSGPFVEASSLEHLLDEIAGFAAENKALLLKEDAPVYPDSNGVQWYAAARGSDVRAATMGYDGVMIEADDSAQLTEAIADWAQHWRDEKRPIKPYPSYPTSMSESPAPMLDPTGPTPGGGGGSAPPVPPVPPAVSTPDKIKQASDAWARSSFKSLPASTRQIALAIGLFESGYGIDWITKDGKRAYNWGAVRATGSEPFVLHPDKDASGKSVMAKFAAFPSIDAGLARFMAVWGAPDVLAAAARGDAQAVAKAMYGHHYFTGTSGSDSERINLYAAAIGGAADTVARALGEKMIVTNVPTAPGGVGLGTVALLGGLGFLAYHFVSGRSASTTRRSAPKSPSAEPTHPALPEASSGE